MDHKPKIKEINEVVKFFQKMPLTKPDFKAVMTILASLYPNIQPDYINRTKGKSSTLPKLNALDLNWIDTNTDKTDIDLDKISTPFDMNKVELELGDIQESTEPPVDIQRIKALLSYIITWSTSCQKQSKDVILYRLLASIICLGGVEYMTDEKSLLAVCEKSNLDYLYLRRQMVAFEKYIKQNPLNYL